MTTQVTFEQAVRSFISTDRSRLNVSIPAKVISYDPKTQNASCKPLVDMLLKDSRIIPLPVINDIPVIFPSTDNSALTFPLNKDDTLLLVFSQRSLDNWLQTKNVDPVNPEDFRRHDFSDAIAIPGLFSFPRAINDPDKHTLTHDTDDVVVKHNIGSAQENEVRLKANGSVEIKAGSKSTLTLNLDGTVELDADTTITVNSPTTNWTGDINVTGTVTATTDVVGGGISLNSHTHSGVQSGGSSTGGPQ